MGQASLDLRSSIFPTRRPFHAMALRAAIFTFLFFFTLPAAAFRALDDNLEPILMNDGPSDMSAEDKASLASQPTDLPVKTNAETQEDIDPDEAANVGAIDSEEAADEPVDNVVDAIDPEETAGGEAADNMA